MQATSWEHWRELALERAADAQAVLDQRGEALCAVYIAGYAIECALKAYLRRQGIAFPTFGGAGHNLRGLWKASGFRLQELNDTTGCKTFFINEWDTSLRYEVEFECVHSYGDLVDGAKKVTSWIIQKLRRYGAAK